MWVLTIYDVSEDRLEEVFWDTFDTFEQVEQKCSEYNNCDWLRADAYELDNNDSAGPTINIPL